MCLRPDMLRTQWADAGSCLVGVFPLLLPPLPLPSLPVCKRLVRTTSAPARWQSTWRDLIRWESPAQQLGSTNTAFPHKPASFFFLELFLFADAHKAPPWMLPAGICLISRIERVLRHFFVDSAEKRFREFTWRHSRHCSKVCWMLRCTFCSSSQYCPWIERHWCSDRPSAAGSVVWVAVEVTAVGVSQSHKEISRRLGPSLDGDGACGDGSQLGDVLLQH